MSDHHLLTRYRETTARAHIMRHVAPRVITDQDANTPLLPGALPGDAVALRGIPVVGVPRGIGGAIRGTTPHTLSDQPRYTIPARGFPHA